MSGWVLIIAAIGGWGDVSDMQVHRDLPEAQCRAMLTALAPLKQRVGAVCVGPDGTRVELSDE